MHNHRVPQAIYLSLWIWLPFTTVAEALIFTASEISSYANGKTLRKRLVNVARLYDQQIRLGEFEKPAPEYSIDSSPFNSEGLIPQFRSLICNLFHSMPFTSCNTFFPICTKIVLSLMCLRWHELDVLLNIRLICQRNFKLPAVFYSVESRYTQTNGCPDRFH